MSYTLTHNNIYFIQDGSTPLMAAVQEDRLEAARVLLVECDCNANAKNRVRFSISLVVSGYLHKYMTLHVCMQLL